MIQSSAAAFSDFSAFSRARIVSLESSTVYLSVSAGDGRRTIVRDARVEQAHSEAIVAFADQAGTLLGVEPAQFDAIAFGAGPGSFTGLRIACGVAQGMAFGIGCSIIPVDAFAAIAESAAPVDGAGVAVAIDARMGEVYFAALIREGGRWREVVAASVGRPDEAPALPAQASLQPWVGAGSGFEAHEQTLRNRLGQPLVAIYPDARPRAEMIDRLARIELAAGRAIDAAAAAPRYVRDRVALTTAERQARRVEENAVSIGAARPTEGANARLREGRVLLRDQGGQS